MLGSQSTQQYTEPVNEILDLSQELIRIPSVTACPEERLKEVHQAFTLIYDYLSKANLNVRAFDGKYPSMLVEFPSEDNKVVDVPVMLSGHFDVVAPEPDDSQFIPWIEGDYLWGRGAADMKTVVATYMVWFKNTLKAGPPYPPINMTLVGNEENGENEPMGTPFIFKQLGEEGRKVPKFFIVGERTEEKGDGLWGNICPKSRGRAVFNVVARGERAHSGIAGVQSDLVGRLFRAKEAISEILEKNLTLDSTDGWQSQVRFPYAQVGTQGVYNITPDYGILGVEVRLIPEDNIDDLKASIEGYCEDLGLETHFIGMEGGVSCPLDNPYLLKLMQAVKNVSKKEPVLGKKLPGSSARFVPGKQAVVWGQSGIGVHAKNERHFIPSILPYYQALQEYSRILLQK
jgi:succinyl-diaminopimelate desuccinylase